MARNKTDIFLEKFAHLSKSLQDALVSTKTGIAIQDALRLAQLPDSYCKKMQDLVEKVLMLELSREEFESKLKQDLELSSTSFQIANKVIQKKIFSPLEGELKQYHQIISAKKIKYPEKKPILPTSPMILEHQKPKTKPVSKASPISKIFPVPKPFPEEKKKSIPPKEQVSPHVPEPAEVSVKKPEVRTQELKNFSVPTMSQEQQEKIKNKLLSAMQRRTTPPKVVETMKQLTKEGWKKVKQAVPKKKRPSVKLNDSASSQVFSGEKGKSFKGRIKTNQKEKTPYIFDVKLKEEKEKKEKLLKKQKSISYSKYKPKNPFGKA